MAINNRFKGILLMQLDESAVDGKILRVYEHSWKHAIAKFQSGAFVVKKFGQ